MKEYGPNECIWVGPVVPGVVGELKEAHKSQDTAAIDTAMEELNAAWQNASQEMYAASGAENAGQTGGSQPGAEAPPSGDEDGGVSDVEYEEVDDKKK